MGKVTTLDELMRDEEKRLRRAQDFQFTLEKAQLAMKELANVQDELTIADLKSLAIKIRTGVWTVRFTIETDENNIPYVSYDVIDTEQDPSILPAFLRAQA